MTRTGDTLLVEVLRGRWLEIQGAHSVLWYWLCKTQALTGFSADLQSSKAIDREHIDPELRAALQQEPDGMESPLPADSGLDTHGDPGDNDLWSGRLDDPDSLGSLVDSVGQMTI